MPLAGIRVLEAGRFAAGPSCATVLADWGADVVKIEPPGGDPARGAGRLGAVNPRFNLHNRSRRSIAVNLRTDAGRALVHDMARSADVFVTNMRPSALEELAIDAPTLTALNPRLVYGQITGWGVDSSAADHPSYDHGAFWSYSGMADTFADEAGVPAQPTGGMGDRAAGSALAGAIAALLLRREQTGRGGHTSTSLLANGAWLLGSEMSDALSDTSHSRSKDRRHTDYPTLNCFQGSDGRWFWLQMMFPERHWAKLIDALDAGWLDQDPHFAGGQRSKLAASSPSLIDALDEIFRHRSAEEWVARLRKAGIPCSPVRSVLEIPDDQIASESSVFVEVEHADGQASRAVASPCRFHDTQPRQSFAAPDAGQDGWELLQELGITEHRMSELIAGGVVTLPGSSGSAL